MKRLRLRAKGPIRRGYLVFPILGYDGPIPEEILAELPERLKEFSTLQQLLADEEGRDLVEQGIGDTIDLKFQLRLGSPDRRRGGAKYWRSRRSGNPSRETVQA